MISSSICRNLFNRTSSILSSSIAETSTSALACLRGTSLTNETKVDEELDKLYSKVNLEVRGHDKAVLRSYTTFLQTACHHLSIQCTPVEILGYVRWIQPLLRSKFVHKKYKLHYETRTYIRRMSIKNVTGSTMSTFLEYIERNIPEGVAMKVNSEEIVDLPPMIKNSMQKLIGN